MLTVAVLLLVAFRWRTKLQAQVQKGEIAGAQGSFERRFVSFLLLESETLHHPSACSITVRIPTPVCTVDKSSTATLMQ